MTNIRNWIIGGALALGAAALIGASAGLVRAEGAPKWTGVYAGASIGYAATTTQTDIDVVGFGTLLSLDNLGSSGKTLGLHVGADLQIERFVIGAFADYTWHDQGIEIASPLLGGTLAKMDLDTQWTIGARAGWLASESTLLYGLVGYTELRTGDLDVLNGLASFKVGDFKGWTFGGGVETHLANNIFLSAEYRYTAFDAQSIALVPGLADLSLEPESHEVKARLSYKLGM